MSSGVKVAEETVEAFEHMKFKKKTRYVILYIADGLIKVEHIKERDPEKTQEEEFGNFLEQLPSDCGRYCIVDLSIQQKNGSTKDKLYIITWCPAASNMKSNMLYTTSKKALMDKIREGLIAIQANDLSDLEYAELLDKGSK